MRLSSGRAKRWRRKLRLNRNAFLALLAAILAVGLAKLSGPLAALDRQQEELARLQQRKQTLLAERRSLETEKRRLATEEGQEWAARRRGYLRSGERRLVFSEETGSEGQAVRERFGTASDRR